MLILFLSTYSWTLLLSKVFDLKILTEDMEVMQYNAWHTIPNGFTLMDFSWSKKILFEVFFEWIGDFSISDILVNKLQCPSQRVSIIGDHILSQFNCVIRGAWTWNNQLRIIFLWLRQILLIWIKIHLVLFLHRKKGENPAQNSKCKLCEQFSFKFA